jgi:hypothetical protein
VNRPKIQALVMSVSIAEANPSPEYELHYYRWTDGLVGLLCTGTNVNKWALETPDATLVINAGACDVGSIGATKTSRPRTPPVSGTPAKSSPTAHFTSVDFPMNIRRIIQTVSLFQIVLLL